MITFPITMCIFLFFIWLTCSSIWIIYHYFVSFTHFTHVNIMLFSFVLTLFFFFTSNQRNYWPFSPQKRVHIITNMRREEIIARNRMMITMPQLSSKSQCFTLLYGAWKINARLHIISISFTPWWMNFLFKCVPAHWLLFNLII